MVLLIRVFFFLLCFMMSSANAAEFYEPVQTVRQLGMGGVYVFHENDGAAFTQNPAYTCFTKGLNWALANAELSVGDLANYEFISDRVANNTATPTLDNLSDYMGKAVYLRLGGYTSLSLPCFGSALSYTTNAKFVVQNPAYPHIDTFYMNDITLSIGGGIPLGENLAFGFDVKRTQRTGGPFSFGPDSISLLTSSTAFQTMIDSVKNGGIGYGVDGGLVGRLNMPFNPTASVAWKDMGSTAFTKTAGVDAPARQKDNLVMGLTFEQSLAVIGIAGGLEYRHVTDTGEQIGKKIHMGMEVSLANMDFRTGFYQGYTSYGAGIDFWLFRLEGALYSVEQGAYAGQTPEQRGQISLSVDLSFDPNFQLMDSGGRKRRLKQRR